MSANPPSGTFGSEPRDRRRLALRPPSYRATSRARRPRARFWTAAAVVAVALGALAWPFAEAERPTQAVTNSGFTCKVVFGSTPDALLISGSAPSATVGAGGAIGFEYEFEVLNFTAAQSGHNVYLPTSEVTFSTSAGTLQLFDLKHTITISGSGWSSPGASSTSHKLTASTTFTSKTTPTLSTQKLAVMVNAGYGAFQLAFRWQWTLSYPNGSSSTGAWTTPTSSGFHPSVFYGAPYVDVLSHTASPVTLGTNYTATLSGAISKEPFFLELEYASNGNVVMSHGDTAPAGNSTPYVASILFNSYDGDLQPATMLVHIHNHCGSMLASLSATGVYASSSSVTLLSSTASCPTISFNGSAYSSGAHVTVRPSHSALAITVPSCSGHTFANWTSTADLEVATGTHSSTTVIVTYSGTLEAHYG